MTTPEPVRVHIKNNHASPDTFPPTPEGEAVFTISRERYAAAAARHPDVAGRLDVFIDWDEDNFRESMSTAEVLVNVNHSTTDFGRFTEVIAEVVIERCLIDTIEGR